ncbi:MAG: triose-phosphate isomerase [Spirochaetes bacterium]|nr:triose-phosphate isomerase [Spirochaetota bacterium]
MARKKLIAGNWKMNKTAVEAEVLAKELVAAVGKITERDIMIAPTFTSLAAVSAVIKGTSIKLGAQNMSSEDSGAFTGEISADMLIGAGVSHVILGHSERRSIFKEDDTFINKKVKKALAKNLVPVLCVGETLAEREAGKADSIVGDQVVKGYAGIPEADAKRVVVAYEPVWAIGTGKTATPADADAMHKHIRDVLAKTYSSTFAEAAIILYGGSMNDKNADELLNMPNIDGGLIGGAALKAESFARIINYTKK